MIAYIRENYGADSSETQGLEQIKSAVDALLDQRRTAREQLRQKTEDFCRETYETVYGIPLRYETRES